MPRIKKLLPIQGQLAQAPYIYTDTRFFFTVAGYGNVKIILT